MKNKKLLEIKMRSALIFLLLAGPPASAMRPPGMIYPYQNCNKPAEDFTDSLLSDFSKTEADFCFVCDQNMAGEGQQIDRIKSLDSLAKIPKECFLAMTARGNRIFATRQYKKCGSSTGGVSTGKLCANEKYVGMIHKAFTDMSRCFNFDLERQAQNLAIINQESGGILNVTSSTGARCMAQLTRPYVGDIIKNINNSSSSAELKIYNEARQRCPWISNLLLKHRKVMAETPFLLCQTIRNPHTCLFYKFIGLETNLRNIKENFYSDTEYHKPKHMGNYEFTREDEIQYKIPWKLNEALNVTVEFKDSNIPKKTYTFAHAGEGLWDFIRKIKPQAKRIETSKIPLFKNDKDIQNMFYYWSHNGGSAYSKERLKTHIEKLKQNLARGCAENDSSERCNLRRQIQKGESLSANQALPFFEESIGGSYSSANRREEVSKYVSNLIKNNKETFGFEENSYGTNNMIRHYKNSVKFGQYRLSAGDAIDFQKKVAEICPKVNLVSP